jgi:hypothetical protein
MNPVCHIRKIVFDTDKIWKSIWFNWGIMNEDMVVGLDQFNLPGQGLSNPVNK